MSSDRGGRQSSGSAFPIEQTFRQILGEWRAEGACPPRAEFTDAVVVSLEGLALSKLIDSEYERQNTPTPSGATRILKSVFAKLRGA
jgi:hypothetical protein